MPDQNAEIVRPGIRRLLAPNPSPFTLSGTNTYVLGRGPEFVVIDPGPLIESHLEKIRARVEAEKGKIELVFLTHHHPDHAGGASWLKERAGAPLGAYAGSFARKEMPLHDEEIIQVGALKIQALFTPGHAPDHLTYYLPEERALLSGDLVLGEGSTTLNPPEGNLKEYIRSLRRIQKLQALLLLPGHGPIGEASQRINEMIAHRKARHDAIRACLAQGIQEPEAMVRKVYGEIHPALFHAAVGNVRAHLEALDEALF